MVSAVEATVVPAPLAGMSWKFQAWLAVLMVVTAVVTVGEAVVVDAGR